MDTFMDKLAQRFTAQEMIKANSAAEVEEMNKLKAQVETYTQCLNRMQDICAELEQTAEVAKGKVDAAQLHTDELRDQLLEIRREMQSTGEGGNANGADALADDLAEMLGQLRRSQESRFESLQGAQQAQIESLRSSLESQIYGLKNDQELQFNGVRGMQEDQLESIRDLKGSQIEGLKGLQEEQLEGLKILQEQQLEAMRNSVEDQLDSVRSMIKAQISNIRSGQDGQLDSLRSAIEQQNTSTEAQLNEMKSTLETQLEGSSEFIHKECVKVYRNVQAVVGEENNKQSENIDYILKPMSKKINSLFSVSVMALIFSIVGVVIQILQVFNLLKF